MLNKSERRILLAEVLFGDMNVRFPHQKPLPTTHKLRAIESLKVKGLLKEENMRFLVTQEGKRLVDDNHLAWEV